MCDDRKITAMASLKGVFIWVIVLHNTFLIDPLLEHIPGMAYITLFGGSLGNSIFFMLSGFLISWNYRDRIASGKILFDDFLVRRLRKLYPMYALSNLAALALNVWQYGASAVNLKKIAFTFLLVQGGGLDSANPYNAPSWFVSALVVCYAVYFAGTSRWKNRSAYRVFLTVGAAAGCYLSTAQLTVPFCYSGNGTAYVNFFVGCFLSELYPELEKRWNWLTAAGAAALLGSAYLMLRYGVEIITGGSALAFAFVICPIVLYLAYAEGICARILRWKIFVFLGRISMPVFYWHLVVYIGMRFAFGGMTPARYGLYLLTVLLVSILAERFPRKKKVAAA